MSIKKLFESNIGTNIQDPTNKKNLFDVAESGVNIEKIKERQTQMEPHVNYGNPSEFATYGSAWLYYKSALARISDYYPYDGSNAEITEFLNGCLQIERYILKNLYPRTTGYINLASQGFTIADAADGYGQASSNEYIEFKGGPGTGSATSALLKDLVPNPHNSKNTNSNIYDENIYRTAKLPSTYGKGTRTSNLRANFDDGVTVEFWLKTGSIDNDDINDQAHKQVVFDLWNNEESSSADYGRIRIELTGTADVSGTPLSPFLITVQSGSDSISQQALGATTLHSGLSDWAHYAITLQNTGSNFEIQLYVNGVFNASASSDNHGYTNIGELTPKNTIGRIGALVTAPSASTAAAGWGRLSGSLDEFRYWKVARNAKEIGQNWFSQVRGGSNTDVHNADLGVYFKFNEGITNNSATDSVVLDYSGRATNGTWTGYSTNARNTGSAIVSASAAIKEYEDPIIRTNHPDYISLRDDLYQTGSAHDYNNNYSLISHTPGWIQDEQAENEDSDLRFITHVMGTYFDKIKLQIKEISKLKHPNYVSSSHKPYPLAEHLPQSLGLYSPELFIDSTVLEKFMNRSDETIFENDLEDTKNIIYHNLYNNLASIFKTKGTEKSIRNIFRCFNVDDNILNLTVTSNNQEYELRNNLTQKLLRKNFINFNKLENSSAVIYNRSASFAGLQTDAVSGSIASHPNQDGYGFTYEGNFMFPAFDNSNTKFVRDSNFDKISLFGFVHPENSADDRSGASTTTHPDDQATLKIYAVRDKTASKNVYFELSSAFGTGSTNFSLTSSTYFDVYDNENWNLSVRIRPKKYPYQPFITGSGDSTYEIIFAGYNPKAPGIYDSFRITTDTTGSWPVNLIRTRKRPYVGADRTNLTGTVNYRSDVYASSVAFWMKYIGDDDLIQHAFDFENIGISGSYKPISALDTSLRGFNAKNIDTLVLNWNFRNVTGSDATGNFVVQDFSSGSSTATEREDYGWVGAISKFNYLGYGYGFENSSTNPIELKSINNYKFINPEKTISSDMIQLFSDEDVMFPNLRRNEIVPNFVFSLEKSLYESISQEMLDFFAGAADFQNIIGRPVNKYRGRYKELEKLREIFFRRVKNVSTVEKYIDYYKWIDDSISAVVSQLIPISAEYIDGVTNVIESHVLERNKYQNKLNIIDSDLFWRKYEPFIPGMGSSGDLSSPAGDGATDAVDPTYESADLTSLLSPETSPRPTNKTPGYWKERAERSQFDITSNNTIVDEQREKIRKAIYLNPIPAHASASIPTLRKTDGIQYRQHMFRLSRRTDGPQKLSIKIDETKKTKDRIKGGRNPKLEQRSDFTLTSVRPAGPVNKENNVFVPLNVLVGFTSESVERTNFIKASTPDNLIEKQTKIFKVQQGRDWQDGLGYKNTKSNFSFPFNIISSSVEVSTGYNKEIVNHVGRNLEITNLHIDAYGPMQEVPIQGPFTRHAVGGHQSRHIAINRGTDSPETRAEAWRILLGTCGTGSMPSGAIGLVGPDYPPADYNPPAGTIPYPYTAHQKAYLYRDHIAKRPVNIKNISQKFNDNTVLGNYQNQYEIIHSFGALNNARAFIEEQPTLPSQLDSVSSTTNVRTFLDRHREAQGHFKFVDEYSVSYLTGTTNKSIIRNRFSAPGGPEVLTPGFSDFKSGEYSPYNAYGFKYLSVIKPSQGPSGSIPELHGGIPTTSRVFDIHGKDYGLNSHYARHTAKFGRDSVAVRNIEYTLNNNMFVGASRSKYNYPGGLVAWWRLNEDVSSAGVVADSSGNGRTGSFSTSGERPAFASSLFPSRFIQTGSCTFDGGAGADDNSNIGSAADWDSIIGNNTSGGSTQKMTITAWIRPLSDGENNFGRVIDFGNQDVAVFVGGESGGAAYLYFSAKFTGAQGTWRTTSRALTLSQWNHVGVSFDATDASNNPTIYINGTAVAVTESSTPSGDFDGITTQDCFIGNISGSSRTFDGQIADLAVWNSVLADSDVQTIYSVVNVTDASEITETGPPIPGTTYDQLPGFHKTHRNRRERMEISGSRLITFNTNKDITNTLGLYVSASSAASAQYGKLFSDGPFLDPEGDTWVGKQFTLSIWLYRGIAGYGGNQTILSLGDGNASLANNVVLGWEINNSEKQQFAVQTSVGNKVRWAQTDVVPQNTWTHLAVTFNGETAATDPVLYMNGVSQSVTRIGNATTSSMREINSVGGGDSYMAAVHDGVAYKTMQEVGLDELAVYNVTMSADKVYELYASGGVLNLTSAIAPHTSSLATWLRFGQVATDPTSNAQLTGSGSPDHTSSTFHDAIGNNNYHIKGGSVGTGSNAYGVYLIGVSGAPAIAPSVLATASILASRLETVYHTQSVRDNFYVQRPIPQSDRQYLWLSRSTVDVGNIKYAGYQNTMHNDTLPYRSSSLGLYSTPYWDFVTSSQATTGSFYQPTNGLNIIVIDPVDDDNGVMGSTTIEINEDLVGAAPAALNPDYLNQLLHKRGSKYGWGWNKLRQNDHPLIRKQKRENELVIRVKKDADDTLTKYNLHPVSMKGRPMLINVTGVLFGADPTAKKDTRIRKPKRQHVGSMTYKVTNTNETLFFSDRDLNEHADIDHRKINRSYRNILKFGRQSQKYGLNWLLYSQNIFPSTRNEFISGTERPKYDSLYWRDIRGDDIDVNHSSRTSRLDLGIERVKLNSFGYTGYSQSAWLLDPEPAFLTRTSSMHAGKGHSNLTQIAPAGELQNHTYRYNVYRTSPMEEKVAQYPKISALYARCHVLDTYNSVVSPYGPQIESTGSTRFYSASFWPGNALKIFGSGEALWEAGENAGINKLVSGNVSFVSAPSQPWWNDYNSFKEDLNLKAKGFAVIPEFRISEHVEEYSKIGVKTKTFTGVNTFEIPGASHTNNYTDPITSGDTNFYKDYSNSDFLKDFLRVSKDSLLNAKQIRLSCTGAIRYNAYKGFYPAQRTLDLVSQFSKSFGEALTVSQSATTAPGTNIGGGTFVIKTTPGYAKQLTDSVFSPGILYNSIRSGIAVDYPLIHDGLIMKYGHFGDDDPRIAHNNWALTITGSIGSGSTNGSSQFSIASASSGYHGGQFWTRRLPFEAIIRPKSFLPGYSYLPMESHPSMSAARVHPGTASIGDIGDDVYNLMARNFFGETANFFLDDSELTTLRSNTVTNDLQFSEGEVYMSRIKLRRSHNGNRQYQFEQDTFGKSVLNSQTSGSFGSKIMGLVNLNSVYSTNGCRGTMNTSTPTDGEIPILLQTEFPLPQDPIMNPNFKETFTMYSRPTAFGPPVAGRPTGSNAYKVIVASGSSGTKANGHFSASFAASVHDSFVGVNPAFTPPYYDGEAWVDLIFRPQAGIAYDLERILAETSTYSWRFDAGPLLNLSGSNAFKSKLPKPGVPALMPVQMRENTNLGVINDTSPNDDNTIPSPYDGLRINVNSMQLTSSLDIFGVERVLEQDTTGRTLNKTVGQKWLIRPKWETPMLNFSDTNANTSPISVANGNLTIPSYASASVPRGMWHQFGTIPASRKIGVFMEINEIPLQWLSNHYLVTNTGSIYNNFDVTQAPVIAKNVKSLAKLCGFNRTNSEKRLGEIKESLTVSEAIVAIPYVSKPMIKRARNKLKSNDKNLAKTKKFIGIPKKVWREAKKSTPDRRMVGDSLLKMKNALQKFIFPPEFDCLNNPNVAPVAMYVFEFNYKFDRDDLSYMWQNMAPRDFKKLSFQSQTVSHNLGNNELINKKVLSNPDLRWMVFKVKQRANTDYYDLLVDQAGEATRQIDNSAGTTGPRTLPKYPIQFNWPYDYLSFVELIKLDVDILLKKD